METASAIKRICVFCGSSEGNVPSFSLAAQKLGRLMVDNNIDLVYGGASVGIMGAMADSVLECGGKVFGVLPEFLQTKEIAHEGLSKLFLVESMHERKKMMDELSDAVIALPGGFGTLEELFEMLTWAQLGLHQKPIGLLNVNNYYDPLIAMIAQMTKSGLLRGNHKDLLIVATEAEELLASMKVYQAPEVGKWMNRSQL